MIDFSDYIKTFEPTFITEPSLWKICDEYRVMAALMYFFPDEFFELKHSDKPDLQLSNVYGIEVTKCTEDSYNRSIGEWTNYRMGKNGSSFEKCKKVIDEEGGQLWGDGMITHAVSDQYTQMKAIRAGINKKILKLKTYKEKFEKCALAIILEEPVPPVINLTIEFFNKIQEGHELKFDELLIVMNYSLIRYNAIKNEITEKVFSRSESRCLSNIDVIMGNGLLKDIKECFIYQKPQEIP